MSTLEERTLSDSVRRKLIGEIGYWDKLSQSVMKRHTGGRMRVYVPPDTPPGREEDYKSGGFRFVGDQYRPAIEYVQQRMADDERQTLIFTDYLHRVTGRNNFFARAGNNYVLDSTSFVYLYVTARSSYAEILKLITDASQNPRIGFLTTDSVNLERGGQISDEAIGILAALATDAFIGIYDEEALGIWTF